MITHHRDRARDRQIQESYAQHQEGLRCLVESQGQSWDLAMDVVQDFFLRWLQMPANSRSQPDPEKERAWLERCVWLRGYTQHNRQRRKRAHEKQYRTTRPVVNRHTPPDDLAEQELPEVIRRILANHFKVRQRRVYRMWSRGAEPKQIADRLGVSADTARRILREALAILREQLARRGWSVP